MNAPIFTPDQARRTANKHGYELMLALEGLLAPSDPMKPAEYAPRVEYARRILAKARGKTT